MWLYRFEYSSVSKNMTDCHVCLGQPCNAPLCSCVHVERCCRRKRICIMCVVSLSYVCEYVFEYLLNGHTMRAPLPLHSYLLCHCCHFCHHCKHMTMIGDTCRERDHLSLNCGSARCGQSQTLAEVIFGDRVWSLTDHWSVNWLWFGCHKLWLRGFWLWWFGWQKELLGSVIIDLS